MSLVDKRSFIPIALWLIVIFLTTQSGANPISRLLVQIEVSDAPGSPGDLSDLIINQYSDVLQSEFNIDVDVLVKHAKVDPKTARTHRYQTALTVHQTVNEAASVNNNRINANAIPVQIFSNTPETLERIHALNSRVNESILRSLPISITNRQLLGYQGWRRPTTVTIRTSFDTRMLLDPGSNHLSSIATSLPAPWALDRLNQAELPLDGDADVPRELLEITAENIDVYILDTGVRLDHREFGGRARRLMDRFPDQSEFHPHGTFVASLVGGETVGVSPRTNLYDARVLNKDGEGYLFDLAVGLEAVLDQCLARGGKENRSIVINISAGGQGTITDADAEPLGYLLERLYRECDAYIAVAAGNNAQDSCGYLPAAFTATGRHGVHAFAASTASDNVASFSNYGACVTLHAPGKDCIGAWPTATTHYNSRSGTSMSSPYGAGVAAVHKLQCHVNFPSTHGGLLCSEYVDNKMRMDAIGIIRGVRENTTPGLLRVSRTVMDTLGGLEILAPITPTSSSNIGSTSDATCLRCDDPVFWSCLAFIVTLDLIIYFTF